MQLTDKFRLALLGAIRWSREMDRIEYLRYLEKTFTADQLLVIEACMRLSQSAGKLPATSPLGPPISVYQQHCPLVVHLLDALVKGRLSPNDYPFLGNEVVEEKAQDVIIFVIGGVHPDEAAQLRRYCKLIPAIRAVIGGTSFLNQASMMEQLTQLTEVLIRK